MIVVSVTFMLVSGVVAVPPVGIATLAGLVGAGILSAFPPDQRNRNLHLTSAGTILLVLMVLTFARPLGLDLSTVPLLQIITTAIVVALTWFSIHLCVRGISGENQRRYQLELLLMLGA